MGRPSKYNPQFHPKMAELAARSGMIDREIAEHLDISEATLNNWKNEYPEFLESLKRGKEIPDDKVEASLYKKAIGYEEDDVHITQYQGDPVIIPYVKKYQPDTTSIIFWLKNRRPERWRDKQEIDIPGGLTIDIKRHKDE